MRTKFVTTIFVLILCAIALLSGCENGSGDGSSSATDGGGGGGDTGIGGSMARFAIIDNYLYTISGRSLNIFDITSPSIPSPWSSFPVGFDIETLFDYRNHLYIGASNGVYIYDNSNPAFPQFLSLYSHIRGCDPVVVQGNYAYVTLRGNGWCRGAGNQLDVLDISSPSNPVLVKSYAMQGPKGLGIDGDKLFVCDGIAGLKVFNAADPENLLVADTVPELNCYDVIPHNQNLVVSDDWGILQYNYASLPMQQSSEIPVTF